ncbi:expressed unknown protein [Seminavis robusta]|uniref:Hydroxyproline O-arabinosyltransferase-like domain-containing protein n=1 Tax=Seminavis robusta TaxID=568900 RepID=A0A9N8DSK6_9STRA|nr:expressed unknown protein [Seminavis robusta]|eukprot:Sro341_g121380.1 n/a (550) ;mRNA; r:14517-16166
MPSALRRGRGKLVQTPLSRESQPRAAKPFLVYVAVSVVVILVLHVNLLLRIHPGMVQLETPTTLENPSEARRVEETKNQAPPSSKPKVLASGREKTTLSVFKDANCKGIAAKQITATSSEAVELLLDYLPKSAQIQGAGLAQVFVGDKYAYVGTVMELEGCVDFYNLFDDVQNDKSKFSVHSSLDSQVVTTARKQVDPALQRQFATVNDLSKPHTRFIFSCESSEYFGYQVYANALGFLKSMQTDASWLRLLTSQAPDDLSERFATFTAPRQLYSGFYHPINKADVIDKWMHSLDAPHPDDTLVVIDPDNWLINDIHKWATRVSAKHAMGQRAYYSQNPMLQELWQEICLNNCQTPTDFAAVPYVIKASDMKEVAPLWRSYSIDIKERFQNNVTFKEKYGPGLGVRWAAEMFGYNAACTHLNIKTTIANDMQIRDVDGGKRKFEFLNGKMPMIHMGRAWFPREKPEIAAPWRHSSSNEPGSIAASGIQVWCKCNQTAPKVLPWPLPDGLDFVSYHTLTLLHDSIEKFGPIPVNETWRKKRTVLYAWSHP